MITTDLNFETFAQDAQAYINDLSKTLEHPHEKERVLKIWRAVMHTLRDRMHLGESFKVIASLPMILKGVYVEGWKYQKQPPLDYSTLEEMKSEVKKLQKHYGEQDFPWKKSTEQIISETINSLKRFISDEQITHIQNQMPKEIKAYLKNKEGS